MNAIQQQAAPETMAMTCWCKFDDSYVIARAVDGDPDYRSRSFDKDYAHGFDRIRLTIYAGGEERTGSLSIWRADLAEYVRGPDNKDFPVEDTLMGWVNMPLDRMKALVDELVRLPKRPELKITLNALLFEEESERIHYEPGDHRSYLLVYDHHPPLVLNSIRWQRMSSKDEDLFSLGG